MRISVIIPTYNRPGLLRSTLEGISTQSTPRDEFEVIVVDDGSDGDALRQTRAYQPSYLFQLIERPHSGLASARNAGADYASGQLLYFLDDDVIPHPDAVLQHLRAHMQEDEPVAVIGSLPYPDHIQMNAFLWYLQKRAHYDLYQAGDRKYPGGHPPVPPVNGNASIPKGLFMDVGGYDEAFTKYGCEDLDLDYRLVENGSRCIYHPSAVGYHNHAKSFDRFCEDMDRAGESLIRLYRKHPGIRKLKKIDIVEEDLGKLRGKKKMLRLGLSLTLSCPWVLLGPKRMIRSCESVYSMRYLLYPLIYWASQYHYACGMTRELGLSQP